MSAIKKTLDRILKTSLIPLLATEGFRKVGHTFYREFHSNTQLVHLQPSLGNVATHVRFTLNLGVYSPIVSKIVDKRLPGGLPKEYECTLRQRAGNLMPGGNDYWWTLPSDQEPIIREIADFWQTYGRKWLDTVQTDEAILDYIVSCPPSLESAKVLLYRGKPLNAKQCVLDIVMQRQQANPHYVRLVKRWALAHGLIEK